jgi:uncharacterized protein GlcG (DUF336 family)
MTSIRLSQASAIADAALEKARELNLRPLAVTVLDPGGNVCVTKREDNAGILRPNIAYAKAWGTLGMGVGGGRIAEQAKRGDGLFFTALAAISQGRIASSRGGVLIRDSDGEVIGAVGVSGDRPENDETSAVFGIERVGLVADAG